MEYIGISNDRLQHIIGVARKAYQIAKKMGHSENFARKMFMIGWMHDVGYEFSPSQDVHSIFSVELFKTITAKNGVVPNLSRQTLHAISKHGLYPDEEFKDDIMWKIITMADMQIDSKGNEVTVTERLNDIKERYGEHSDQYLTACDVCYMVRLTPTNIASHIS